MTAGTILSRNTNSILLFFSAVHSVRICYEGMTTKTVSYIPFVYSTSTNWLRCYETIFDVFHEGSRIPLIGACGCLIASRPRRHIHSTMVQGCPVEVLDSIFEHTSILRPSECPSGLPLITVHCSHFRAIATGHFIRIVCLPTAEKVNGFAGHLK